MNFAVWSTFFAASLAAAEPTFYLLFVFAMRESASSDM